MVHSCCAINCTERARQGSQVTFHSFPKEESRRKLWLNKIRRENFNVTASSKVCSKHFTPDSFDREKFGGTWLKKDAVPTLFDFPKHLQKVVSKRKQPTIRKDQTSLPTANESSYQGSNATKKDRKCPNYFIAVQITDPKVHSSIKTIQDHILLKDNCFKKSLISRSTLHITLEVMYLKDSEDHSRAVKALNAVYKKYNYIMCKEPLQIEFRGVGHFGNRVLFAKIKENSSYSRLCDLAVNIGQQLEAVGINTSDSKKNFYPHLTIAKLTYVKKSSKTIKKIPPSLYQEFIDFHFGCDIVKSIQLLKMAGPKTSSGYYMGEELFFSLKEHMYWKKLNSLLAIAEKKREIRKKISTLAEKLLK